LLRVVSYVCMRPFPFPGKALGLRRSASDHLGVLLSLDRGVKSYKGFYNASEESPRRAPLRE